MKEMHLALAEELERLAAGYRALATSEKTAEDISLQEISAVLAEKMRKGKIAAIKTLLKKYGAEKLVEVKQEDYESVFREAEGL